MIAAQHCPVHVAPDVITWTEVDDASGVEMSVAISYLDLTDDDRVDHDSRATGRVEARA